MTDNLSPVRTTARKAVAARSSFHAAIRDASAAGASTRAIAQAAGLSHQRIWQIIRAAD